MLCAGSPAHARTGSMQMTCFCPLWFIHSLCETGCVCSTRGYCGSAQNVVCNSKSMRNRMSLAWLVLLSVTLLTLCLALPTFAEAQPQDAQTQQGQSVSDAARQSREQKKNAAKQARVISNEDLDLEYYKRGQEGFNFGPPAGITTAEPSVNAVVPAELANPAVNPPDKESRPKDKSAEEAASEDAEITKLKEKIKETEEKLKWQQREFALDQDTVYSNPNYTDLQTGKARLDSEQQAINDRQQEIEGLKASLADLEEHRKQAAPPASTPPPISVPPQS
jgi:hypothetical protein